MTTLVLRGARVIDPAAGLDAPRDLLVREGVIAAVVPPGADVGGARVVDLAGLVIAPGFVDLRAVIRTAADLDDAAAGGFTVVFASPESEAVAPHAVSLHSVPPLSKWLKGDELGEVPDGTRLISNGFSPLPRSSLVRRALQYATPLNAVVMVHCEDPSLSGRGVIGEGRVATHLGLLSVPSSAEVGMVARDLAILEDVGGRLHLSHLTCAGSIARLREARRRGLQVTADVAIHHLLLCDEVAADYSLSARIWPPLRSAEDRSALCGAVHDGTVQAIASDHWRVDPVEREHPFDLSAPGRTSLATALEDALTAGVDLPAAIRALTQGPCDVTGLKAGTLAEGSPADLVVVHPASGRMRYTLKRGVVIYEGAER